MKKALFVLVFLYGTSSVFAGSCTNLTETLSRYQETPAVLSLQKFLAEKGYLKNPPNGYFGAGTFSAVKAYQKSIGLEQAGKYLTEQTALKNAYKFYTKKIENASFWRNSIQNGLLSAVEFDNRVQIKQIFRACELWNSLNGCCLFCCVEYDP